MATLNDERLPPRFWNKIGVIDGCWIWFGAADQYAHFQWEGKVCNAHRIAYLVLVGPIDDGLELDHFFCDIKLCVNPDHMRPATPKQNSERAPSFNRNKTHCKRGHPFDAVIHHMGKDGSVVRVQRSCTACRHGVNRVPTARLVSGTRRKVKG